MFVPFAVPGIHYTCLCSNVFHVVICHVAEYASSSIRRPKIWLFLVLEHRKTGKPPLACMGNPCNLSSTPTSNKHTFSGEWGLFLQTRVISRTQMVHSSWVLGGRCFSNQVTLANLKELQVDRWHEWWQCPSGCWKGSKSIVCKANCKTKYKTWSQPTWIAPNPNLLHLY